MSKMHVVYDTLAQVRYPNRQTQQFALCGTYAYIGDQYCLDDPAWASPEIAWMVCKRCRAKAEKLTERAGGTLTVKPGLVVPPVAPGRAARR